MNMDLFVVENEEVNKELMDFLTEHYSWCGDQWENGCGLWINGEKIGGKWFVSKNYHQEGFSNGINV